MARPGEPSCWPSSRSRCGTRGVDAAVPRATAGAVDRGRRAREHAGALARLGRHRAHDAEHARVDWPGITGAVALARRDPPQRGLAEQVLGAVGRSCVRRRVAARPGHRRFPASGPAYVFFFIEAMQQAARDMGLDEAQARTLAVQTFVGAAQLRQPRPSRYRCCANASPRRAARRPRRSRAWRRTGSATRS